MQQIALSDDVYSRLVAFQQVRKAVLEDDEEWSVDQLAEMLICSGIDSSLTGLWKQQERLSDSIYEVTYPGYLLADELKSRGAHALTE